MVPEQGGSERFDESRVRQILRRAIEIDELTASTIDAEELREIAASVGISAEALDLALDEVRRAEEVRRRVLKNLRRVRRVMAVAAAIVLGLLTTFLGMLFGANAGGDVMLASVVVLIAVVLMLAVYNRSRGNQRTYQIDNAAIWAGFVLVSRPASVLLGESIPTGVLAWLALAVLGLLLIGRRQSEPPSLSRELVVDRVLGFVRDQTDRDGEAERRDLPAHGESPGGLGVPLAATS